jgi:tetratricopeptide (TPR) repeat protein
MPENSAKPFLVMANSFYKAGDLTSAIEYYHKAIGEYPSYDKAYYNLGVVYNKAGMEDKAIECFKVAASLGHEAAMDIIHQLV